MTTAECIGKGIVYRNPQKGEYHETCFVSKF